MHPSPEFLPDFVGKVGPIGENADESVVAGDEGCLIEPDVRVDNDPVFVSNFVVKLLKKAKYGYLWERVKDSESLKVIASTKVHTTEKYIHGAIRVRNIHDALHSVFVGPPEGLKHEEVTDNQIRLFCLVGEKLRKIVGGCELERVMASLYGVIIVELSEVIVDLDHFDLGKVALELVEEHRTRVKQHIKIRIFFLQDFCDFEHRDYVARKEARIQLDADSFLSFDNLSHFIYY